MSEIERRAQGAVAAFKAMVGFAVLAFWGAVGFAVGVACIHLFRG